MTPGRGKARISHSYRDVELTALQIVVCLSTRNLRLVVEIYFLQYVSRNANIQVCTPCHLYAAWLDITIVHMVSYKPLKSSKMTRNKFVTVTPFWLNRGKIFGKFSTIWSRGYRLFEVTNLLCGLAKKFTCENVYR